jgi:hypothetical protein
MDVARITSHQVFGASGTNDWLALDQHDRYSRIEWCLEIIA